jgi:hypothetical protein
VRRLCALQEAAGEQDTIAFCWSHLRREFFTSSAAMRRSPPSIAQIYAVEKDLRGASADARRASGKIASAHRDPKVFFEHQLARLSVLSASSVNFT